MEKNLKQNEDTKAILDKKIQQNNINLKKYKYCEYDRAYERFEDGRYDGVIYKIALDEKGYLTEKFIDEGPQSDLDDITVYDDNGNKFRFTTMDDSYNYECKNGNLYYVGYSDFDDTIYGAIYQPKNKEVNQVSKSSYHVLYENTNLDSFKEKKEEILNEFINTHENTKAARMQTCERKTSEMTSKQKEAVQNFLASKFGTKEDIKSAYEMARQELSDVLPPEHPQEGLEHLLEPEDLFL